MSILQLYSETKLWLLTLTRTSGSLDVSNWDILEYWISGILKQDIFYTMNYYNEFGLEHWTPNYKNWKLDHRFSYFHNATFYYRKKLAIWVNYCTYNNDNIFTYLRMDIGVKQISYARKKKKQTKRTFLCWWSGKLLEEQGRDHWSGWLQYFDKLRTLLACSKSLKANLIMWF